MNRPLSRPIPCRRWGNFEHVGCRGDTTEASDELGGDGFVSNIHITDLEIEVRAVVCRLRRPCHGM